MASNTTAQIRAGLFTLLFVVLIGTFGYHIIEEEWTLFDSFYMTVITISTTGFREIKELSLSGRILTVFLILGGVSAIAYTGGRSVQLLLETQVFRRHRMGKKIEGISNHYIVCGFGRMGEKICEGLVHFKAPFVVIENDPEKLEKIIDLGYLYINGDATSDEVLLEAGIKKAKGFVAVVRTDAENVFATLSAKELNPGIFLVSRAVDEGSESKLLKAGADRVVKPYELGGGRMVQLLLRPGVMDFIDGVARNRDVEIALEEIHVPDSSPLVGKSLMDSPVRRDLNIIIVAISRSDGTFIYNPGGSAEFMNGDKLIAIGEHNNLNKLTELCNVT